MFLCHGHWRQDEWYHRVRHEFVMFWHDTPILLNTPIDPPGLGDRISTHVEERLGVESPFIPIDQPRMQGSSQDQHSMSEHDIVQLEHGMETLDLGTETVTFDLRQGGARPKDRFHARHVLGAMSQAASTVAGAMGGVFSSITTLATCSRARAHDNQYSSGLNTSGRQATRPMSIPLRQGRSYGWRPEQVSRRNEREYQFPSVNYPLLHWLTCQMRMMMNRINISGWENGC